MSRFKVARLNSRIVLLSLSLTVLCVFTTFQKERKSAVILRAHAPAKTRQARCNIDSLLSTPWEYSGKFVSEVDARFLSLVNHSFDVYGELPSIVVDVGGNIGEFAKLMCSSLPKARVHVFEPGSEMFAWLQHNTKKACTSGQVSLHRNAVSNVDGESVVLYGPPKRKEYTASSLKPHNTGASISVGVNSKRGSTRILGKVKTIRLDTFFVDVILHLVKIDAEGLDPLIIRGLESKLQDGTVSMLYWEYGKHWAHASTFKYSQTVKYLEGFGFSSHVLGVKEAVQISGQCWHMDLDKVAYTHNVLSVRRGTIFGEIPSLWNKNFGATRDARG